GRRRHSIRRGEAFLHLAHRGRGRRSAGAGRIRHLRRQSVFRAAPVRPAGAWSLVAAPRRSLPVARQGKCWCTSSNDLVIDDLRCPRRVLLAGSIMLQSCVVWTAQPNLAALPTKPGTTLRINHSRMLPDAVVSRDSLVGTELRGPHGKERGDRIGV